MFFEKNSLEIPDEYKPYIDKIIYSYHDHILQIPNGSYIYTINASPRIHFQPNVFTDWETSVDTRRKLNEMFYPHSDHNFMNFLVQSNENVFDGLIRREFGYIIDPAEAYYMQFPDEYDDSDETWEREDWENRYENWGDGAISVYNEKVITNVETGEVYEPTEAPPTKLRRR